MRVLRRCFEEVCCWCVSINWLRCFHFFVWADDYELKCWQ